MSLRNISKDELLQTINNSNSKREVLRKLGYHQAGRSATILNSLISEYKISIDHFKQKLQGIAVDRLPDDLYFVNGVKRDGGHLKHRLLQDGHLEEECSICGIGPEWNGEFLSLQVDHKDGDNQNNELHNLRLVCPNCHSQTDTWGGKRFKKTRTCNNCESAISRHSKSGFCRECHSPMVSIKRRKFDPTPEELKELVANNSLSAVGRMFGVSDNAVRKRCIKCGINWKKELVII